MSVSRLGVCLVSWVVFAMTLATLDARQINWRGITNKTNLTSADTPLNAGFVFELGCFEEGFAPTAGNTGEWSSHWHTVAQAPYRESDATFSASYFVASNQAPTTFGKRVYIWGHGLNGSTHEWILAGNPTWTWPSPSDIGFALTWVLNSSTETVIGSIGGSSDPVYLRTSAVSDSPPPVGDPETWRRYAFGSELSNPLISDWHADPDDDGWDNLTEYALAKQPLEFDGEPALLAETSTHGNSSVSLTRHPNRKVTTSIEISEDFEQWASPPPGLIAVDTPSELRLVLGLDVYRLFVRVRVTLEDG